MAQLIGGIIAIVIGDAMMLGTVFVVAMLLSYPVMLLWNGCLVGLIDGVHPIGWLQTLGILILFAILFKSSSSKSKD